MNHTDFEHLKKLMALGKISANELEERLRIYDSINDDEALEQLRQLVSETRSENGASAQNISLTPHHSPLTSRHSLYRIAAAIALLLVAGGLVWYTQYTKVTPPEISQAVQLAMQRSVESGKAQYTLADNGTDLQDDNARHNEETGVLQEQLIPSSDGMQAPTDSHISEPIATDIPEDFDLMTARRVTTYHDKEFWLKLADGTLVHLNYNTRVVYPEKFGRGKREVILDGEAYFMVAKDKSRPFIVHTPQGDVKVYGTEFVVNSQNAVVLIKGSVGFTPKSGHEMKLQPGQQCTLLNGQWAMSEADLEPYIAWNEGRFSFDNVSLEKLMDVLSRWYGLEIRFESDKHRQTMFTGELDKFVSVEPTLRAIRKVTDVNVRISGNTIIIQ